MFHIGDAVRCDTGDLGVITGAFDWDSGLYTVQMCESENEEELSPLEMALESRSVTDGDLKPKKYKLSEIPGKGFGLVVSEPIKAGEIVIQECPVISISRDLIAEIAMDDSIEESKDGDSLSSFRESEIIRQFDSLDKCKQQRILALHSRIDDTSDIVKETDDERHSDETLIVITKDDDCEEKKEMDIEKDRVISVYATNSYNTNSSSVIESGLFLEISRLNHSCFPNCEQIPLQGSSHQRTVVALFDLDIGTELSVSYIGALPWFCIRRDRMSIIKSRFDFDCLCSECMSIVEQSSDDDINHNDDDDDSKHYIRDDIRIRLNELSLKLDVIRDHNDDSGDGRMDLVTANECLKLTQEMISLFDEHFNGVITVTADWCLLAAQCAIYLSKHTDALCLIKRALKADVLIYQGNRDSNDLRQCLKMLHPRWKKKFPFEHFLI